MLIHNVIPNHVGSKLLLANRTGTVFSQNMSEKMFFQLHPVAGSLIAESAGVGWSNHLSYFICEEGSDPLVALGDFWGQGNLPEGGRSMALPALRGRFEILILAGVGRI